MLCVPCLVSLAEGDDDSSAGDAPSISSSEEGSGSPADSDGSESDVEDGSESTESGDSDSSESSSKEPESSSSSESSSSGSRFTGDPVQGKTPKFADLKLGDGDPDDGKDFTLKPEESDDGLAEVVIRNTEAKGMKGNDNFRIKFDGCELWLPIEIPASCVEDDHINSKLVVSYGEVDSGVAESITSSVQSSHILQTFRLALTSYDVKGQASAMDTFDGRIKFVIAVNSACVNQYNRDKKLALLAYNSGTRSLEAVEYELDAEKSELTVYTSNSGSFFLINSNDMDISAPIKLNTNAPFLKVMLYLGTFASIAASIALIAVLIVRGKKQKLKNAKH